MNEAYDPTNKGGLCINDKGDNPNRPDFTGQINVEGKEYYLSVWKKQPEGNKPVMSIALKPKESTQNIYEQSHSAGNQYQEDNSIPF